MYSGYLNIPNTQKYYHYLFVPSTGDATTDPVVLWLNGGPGCSSLDGFFYEHGPYKFGPGLENITLVNNPNAYVRPIFFALFLSCEHSSHFHHNIIYFFTSI